TTYGELCGVRPDLTCLGKIVGGGMPLGAVGGRRACMESLAPLGDVYQAGTLSGNPVAVAAGTAMLRQLVANPPYAGLEQLAAKLAGGLNAIAAERGLILHAAQMGAMFTPFFTQGPVRNLNDAKSCDTEMYAKFFRGMLGAGFYLPPSQFEVAFLSAAHTEADVDRFLSAATRVLGE
ncbi:MAG: aminotransferase class III-fold pyridoxal phosphate-dependent enzyme, partial [Nitrospinaceae bacterium]|nr:aminotransferase class III-fold pyridoxal phosphate-dependent enzyme [Nitrospinaceae bacterium]